MTHRWPPLSGLAWNICILFSANDAYMRDLAHTVSDGREDGDAPDRTHSVPKPGTTSSRGLDPEASARGRTPR